LNSYFLKLIFWLWLVMSLAAIRSRNDWIMSMFNVGGSSDKCFADKSFAFGNGERMKEFLIAAILGCAWMVAISCGLMENDKKREKAQSSPTPIDPDLAEKIPRTWDGIQDWPESTWQVTDE
jgi:hypothetical protein